MVAVAAAAAAAAVIYVPPARVRFVAAVCADGLHVIDQSGTPPACRHCCSFEDEEEEESEAEEDDEEAAEVDLEAMLSFGGKLVLPPLPGDRLRRTDAMSTDILHGIVSACC